MSTGFKDRQNRSKKIKDKNNTLLRYLFPSEGVFYIFAPIKQRMK